MRLTRLLLGIFPLVLILSGCSELPKSPDITDAVRKFLDQAGYKDVSVSQDRDKGVVTLGGTVASDSDKHKRKPRSSLCVFADALQEYRAAIDSRPKDKH
jgi:hypothetical protein